jgi:hypothetical protein
MEVEMRARWIVLILLVGILVFACLALGMTWAGGRLKHTPGTGPEVRILDPHFGDDVPMERVVLVQSEARDATNGVTQVELWVDGQLERVDASPHLEGSGQFFAAQSWRPSSPGSHTLLVRAVNGRGAVGQAMIVVEAVQGLVAVGPGGENVLVEDVTSVVYVASAGDTIPGIAESRGVSEEEILEFNPDLGAGEVLEEGQVVDVPFDPGSEAGGGEEQEEPVVGPQVSEEEGPPEPPMVVPEPPLHLGSDGVPVDLSITNLTLSSLNPQPGEEIVVGVTILNEGGTPAENFSWAWDPGTGEGWIEDEAPISFLAPGDDVVLEMSYEYHWVGDFFGRVWADSQGAYDEPNEDNNLADARITVGEPRPFELFDPIPGGLRGDLIRLIWRIRHRQDEPVDESGETVDLDQPPAPPSLEISYEGCEVAVQWCSNSVNEEGFYLYRWDATTGGDFEQVAEFGPTQGCGTWTERVPQPGEYYYQLVASNGFGEGVSDVVREQVTYEECHVVRCDQSLLELEVEGGSVGQHLDSVYCYAAVYDLPEERIPPGQDEFLEVDANHWFDLGNYLSGENSRLVSMPTDQALRVFAECWGWTTGAQEPVLLGEFTNMHGEEDWDGSILYGEGGGFRAQYRINRLASAGCVEVSEGPLVIPAPYDLKLAGAVMGGYGLEWKWKGSENWIEGFWILVDGVPTIWVGKGDVDIRQDVGLPGAPVMQYNEKLPSYLGYPDCEKVYSLSVVAGYRNEPLSSDAGLNSEPSVELVHSGSHCRAVLTVRFALIEFHSLAEEPSEVYGYFMVNGHRLSLGIGQSMDGRSLELLSAEEGPPDVYAPGLHVGEYVSSDEITVSLDEDQDLTVNAGLYDYDGAGLLYEKESDIICEPCVLYPARGHEVWAMTDAESTHHLMGQGHAGSCVITYFLEPGEPTN